MAPFKCFPGFLKTLPCLSIVAVAAPKTSSLLQRRRVYHGDLGSQLRLGRHVKAPKALHVP